MTDRRRADLSLVQLGLTPSREKAQALIMAGQVYYRNGLVQKASELIDNPDELYIKGRSHPYVSRGALKLEKALRVFGADVHGAIAMDIGASTGGFTEVLLQNGAAFVFAIDVGYGQLDWKIRNDPRVIVLERTNARYLEAEQLNGMIPTITVMDVSFISVKLLLPIAARLMRHCGRFYILIKPQFEAGREHIGKRGVVRDPKIHEQLMGSLSEYTASFSYRMTKLDFSPITGPEGNIEYIAELLPVTNDPCPISTEQIHLVVEGAFHTLK